MSEKQYVKVPGFSAYEIARDGSVRQCFTRRPVSAWPNSDGYLYVKMQRAGEWKARRVHRLVWQGFRGPIPKRLEVHHRDSQRANPRLSNLSLLTRAQQMMQARASRGANQYKGVTWCKSRKCFQAQIKKNGKTFFLGRFRTELKAAYAYDRAARRMFGKYATPNF